MNTLYQLLATLQKNPASLKKMNRHFKTIYRDTARFLKAFTDIPVEKLLLEPEKLQSRFHADTHQEAVLLNAALDLLQQHALTDGFAANREQLGIHITPVPSKNQSWSVKEDLRKLEKTATDFMEAYDACQRDIAQRYKQSKPRSPERRDLERFKKFLGNYRHTPLSINAEMAGIESILSYHNEEQMSWRDRLPKNASRFTRNKDTSTER